MTSISFGPPKSTSTVKAKAAWSPPVRTGPSSRSLAPAWHRAEDDAARLRVVVDQVAQLTDSSAVAWHERLVGRAD